MGAMSIQEDHDRQRYLEALYEADGRASKDHPLHGLYTGLLEQRKQRLVELDRRLVLFPDCRHDARRS